MEFHGAPIGRTWTKLAREAYRNEPIILAEAGRRRRLEARRPPRHHRARPASSATSRRGPSAWPSGRRPRSARSAAIRPYVEDGLARADARPAARERPPRRGRLPRRGRQPHPERRRRVGRPGRRPRPHDVPPELLAGRSPTPSSATSARKACSASTACTSTWPATSMRGGSVVGASIWDSKNRWITIHGTSYLVVRDCVGLQVGRPRLLPRGRHRDAQRPRRQPRRHGAAGQAAAGPGAALRQEPRLGLLVGEQPERVHEQRRRRVRPGRVSASRSSPAAGSTRSCRSSSPTGTRKRGRHPHAAVPPVREQRGPLPCGSSA